MLKKKIAVLLSSLILGVSSSAMAAQFTDVPQGHWAAEAIYGLADHGFIYQDGTGMYKGDTNLTRYDFAYMLGKIMEKSGVNAPVANFKDVTANHWANKMIANVTSKEVMSGYGDGTFRGDKAVTRFDIALSLAKLMELYGKNQVGNASSFADVPPGHWAYDAVSLLSSKGLLEGFGDGTFRGDKTITKNEAASMMVKVIAALQ